MGSSVVNLVKNVLIGGDIPDGFVEAPKNGSIKLRNIVSTHKHVQQTFQANLKNDR